MRHIVFSLCASTAAAAALGAGAAQAADSWPSRPVRIVVAFPAGTPGDTVARLIQPALQKAFQQPVVVDNKPGAGGNIGMQEVARASDGHTVLAGPDTMLTVNPHLYRKLAFKPLEALVPVTQMASFSQELVCTPSAGIKTMDQLRAAAKAAPMSYASGGAGVPGHLAMEMLLNQTGMKIQHVAYKGPSPAMQDIIGGAVPCGFLASPTVAPLVRDGKLVAIAVSGNQRLASQPNVPTVAQTGVKGYDATFSMVLAMPRGTPASVVNQLQTEVKKALADASVSARLATLDLEPVANAPAAAAARLKTESERWATVAQQINLQLD